VEAPEGTAWRLIFDGEGHDLVRLGGHWRRRTAERPDLEVRVSSRDWAAMLSQSAERPSPRDVLGLEGDEAEVRRFEAALASILDPVAGARA